MIDASPAGSWRNAANPEGPACRACGQNVCGHSDLEYQGIVPRTATPSARAAVPTQDGKGVAADHATPVLQVSFFPHPSGVARG
jgi:hypothetical protein